jgi:hypothetical protein
MTRAEAASSPRAQNIDLLALNQGIFHNSRIERVRSGYSVSFTWDLWQGADIKLDAVRRLARECQVIENPERKGSL